MYSKLCSLLTILILLPVTVCAADLGLARMSLVQGDVQIRTGDAGDWLPAAINTPVQAGDRLWHPSDGRSEVEILGNVFVRLDAETALDIIALDRTAARLYVPTGRAYVNNREMPLGELEIQTPLAAITCSGGSRVMIDVSESGATDIAVLNGYAFAETERGKLRIPAGSVLFIDEDLNAQFSRLGEADDWQAWNSSLDRRLMQTGTEARYLPPELVNYGHDFATYGRWHHMSGYGYVWTPTLAISLGWSPYRLGKWTWVAGSYVWISREPWGWAPYHYGRWIHNSRFGWCWVPPRRGAVHWGPDYVGWVHTPTHVSWVPLAPEDTYYGHGFYGPGSVNLNSVSLNLSFSQHRYRNLRAPGAVTVLHRDTFIHGRAIHSPLRENPFLQRNVGIGPPRFKPAPATVAPVLKNIPRSKLPPPHLYQPQGERIPRDWQHQRNRRTTVETPRRAERDMPDIRRESPRPPLQERTRHPLTAPREIQRLPSEPRETYPTRGELRPQRTETRPMEPVKRPQRQPEFKPAPRETIQQPTRPAPFREPAPARSFPRPHPDAKSPAPHPVMQQPAVVQPVVQKPQTPAPKPEAPNRISPDSDRRDRREHQGKSVTGNQQKREAIPLDAQRQLSPRGKTAPKLPDRADTPPSGRQRAYQKQTPDENRDRRDAYRSRDNARQQSESSDTGKRETIPAP